MKKYKLIKIYPRSPKINTEIVFATIYNYCTKKDCPISRNTYMIKGDGDFEIEDPENYPENWEEIIDKNPLKLELGKEYILQYIHSPSAPFKCKITRFTKDGYPWKENPSDYSGNGIVSPDCYRLIEEVNQKDYEIISFISNNGIIKKWENGLFGIHFGEFTEKNQISKLEKPGFFNKKIHSVKRLSDGEVFTVKDHVRPKKGTPNNFIITGFTLDCNNKHILALGGNGGISINKLKPVKKPLFTTFDNVDIYEGDSYHTYYLPTNYYSYCQKACKKRSGNKKDVIYFSTKQAAQDYINSKKVLFTTEDGVDIRKGDMFIGVNDFKTYSCNEASDVVLKESVNWLYFSTKEAAENYINLRKPYLSNKDVLEEVIKCNNIKEIIKIFTNKVAH